LKRGNVEEGDSGLLERYLLIVFWLVEGFC